MSLEAEIKAGSLDRGRFRYFPVVPGRVEFAIELRRLLLAEKPPLIAVELPGFLAGTYRRALARLPEMTVILYTDEADDDRAIYVPVEPCDPFTEALRTAHRLDLLLRSPIFERADLSSLRKGYYGASAMPIEIVQR